MMMDPITGVNQTHFEFDTREDAVMVATRMMADGWDVRIVGNVVTADNAQTYVITVYADVVCGLDY